MTQPNLLELAKQGDAKAIASLINRQLQPKGITAKAALKDGCLQIMLESAQVPDQEALIPFIRNGVTRLEIASLRKVKVYGRQTGEDFPDWEREFKLTIASNTTKLQTPTDRVENINNSSTENLAPPETKSIPKKIASPRVQFQSKPSCPRTYLVPSILVTLFACIPAGAIGIILANKVKSNYQQNDYNAAKSASKNAKNTCIIGIVFGVVMVVFNAFFIQKVQQQVATIQLPTDSYIPPVKSSPFSNYSPPIQSYSRTNPARNAFSKLDGRAYILGADKIFLGFISSDRIHEKSICNAIGDYGSRIAEKSVWNQIGNYGSRISNVSAYNANASNPPIIVDENNKIIGVLTINSRIKGSVDPDFLHTAMCER